MSSLASQPDPRRHPDSEGGLTQPAVERPERLGHDSPRRKKVGRTGSPAPSWAHARPPLTCRADGSGGRERIRSPHRASHLLHSGGTGADRGGAPSRPERLDAYPPLGRFHRSIRAGSLAAWDALPAALRPLPRRPVVLLPRPEVPRHVEGRGHLHLYLPAPVAD